MLYRTYSLKWPASIQIYIMGTKEFFYIRKESNSHRICLEQQYGRCFIVLKHQYGRRDKSQTLWSSDVLKVTVARLNIVAKRSLLRCSAFGIKFRARTGREINLPITYFTHSSLRPVRLQKYFLIHCTILIVNYKKKYKYITRVK